MIGGKPLFGQFDGPVASLGLDSFSATTDMDKPASWPHRYFGYKQFEFIAIHTPAYLIGIALADIRYLGSGFCYVFDKGRNRLHETHWLRPPGSYALGPSPVSATSEMAGVRIHRHDGGWAVALNLLLDGLPLVADITLEALPLSLPMAMCSPTGYSGWTYTQKHNALSVKGTLCVNHEPQPLSRALAGYDFSAGFMRRETSWRWASINAMVDGRRLGMNLAAGVNETGSSENVLWLDGVRRHLGPVHFDFNRSAANGGSWRIWSERGELDLTFTPRGCRSEKLNLWLLKSNFRQYLGHFSGWVRELDGSQLRLEAVWGLTEDHFAKW
ncbi:DUF2804 family protein [Shewanella sp. JM162201]|uniref:DUF2804 family protein n=1 Tax=Shewanella jiangmenensis TaxID=2837387 RepID=A0ABS5V416_9GAMM|nr:DUF2804 domain-containing protein [Shewanella jiangmenensis]MBT1444668.1 DUF2804 family protein [Shewanella jiangmenensis]